APLVDPDREVVATFIDGPTQRVREERGLFSELPHFGEDSDEIRLSQEIDFTSTSAPPPLFDYGRRSGTPRGGYTLSLIWSHYPRVPRFTMPVEAELLCRSCTASLIDVDDWGRLKLDPRVFHACPACGHQLKLSRTALTYANSADPENDELALSVETAVYRLAIQLDCRFDWPIERISQRPPALLGSPVVERFSDAVAETLVDVGGFW
ncbi:MAG: hypothetical protein KC609_07825, partial [Myxococcales bacterium]|nr:hypothetical protein [Myxococcales bacterium]